MNTKDSASTTVLSLPELVVIDPELDVCTIAVLLVESLTSLTEQEIMQLVMEVVEKEDFSELEMAKKIYSFFIGKSRSESMHSFKFEYEELFRHYKRLASLIKKSFKENKLYLNGVFQYRFQDNTVQYRMVFVRKDLECTPQDPHISHLIA